MYEVRSECERNLNSCPDGYTAETRRVKRSDAEQDVDLIKLFGRKAWIVEGHD